MKEETRRPPGSFPWISVFSILLGLLAWEAASRMKILPSLIFPPPTLILKVLFQELLSGSILPHLAKTVEHVLLGSSLGALAGIVLALACARWRLLASMTDPWVDATFPIPKVAVIPLFMILVGAGDSLCVTLIAIGMFYYMFIAVRTGISKVDRSLLEAAENLGADGRQILWEVTLPSLLPYLFMGTHLGLLQALRLAVIIEAMFAMRGMGHMLWISGEWLRMEVYYAYILVLAGLGALMVWLLRKAVRTLTPWAHPSFYEQ
jgi:NitT/TauT family transport system permease protein